MESRLKRPKYAMPDFVKDALEKNKLMAQYHKRPPYQQNDYLGWIIRAKRDTTKYKRLQQMMHELAEGNKYMNMKYQAKM